LEGQEDNGQEDIGQEDIREILKYLPHRYPFLLIDRVLRYEPEGALEAIKNVSFNEPIFTGHFPQSPIFPGVLILEAMAQACALHAFKSLGGYPSKEKATGHSWRSTTDFCKPYAVKTWYLQI